MSKKEATLLLRIKEMGGEALDRVVITLGDIRGVAEAVVGGIYKVGETIVEMVKEAEKVRQVNMSFDALARSAGLSADIIKNDLMTAADGLADDTDILLAANRAMISLGSNANRMGETMELARKATVMFGGDMIENFEAINSAVASGNTRILKQFGLIVDADEAIKKYAASLGVSANQLNEAGRSHAILNAVLDKGQTAYKDVDESALQATNSFKRFKVAMAELWETASKLTANGPIGKMTSAFTELATVGLKLVSNGLTNMFGDAADKARVKADALAGSIQRLEDTVTKQKAFIAGTTDPKVLEFAQKNLASLEAQIAAKRAELAEVQGKSLSSVDPAQAAADQAALQEKLTREREIKRVSAEQEAIERQTRMLSDMELENQLIGANEEQKLAAKMSALDKQISAEDNANKKLKLMKDKEALLDQQREQKKQEEEKKRNEEMIKNREATLNTIATLSSSGNKTLAAIGKAAALAQIAIDTPVAIGKALAAAPPPINFALAGAVGAAMAAQAAKISGIQLAEGGIVQPRPGGVQATIAEAGEAEAVIPLSKMEGMFGGGGNITIVVNGGMLGDPSSAQEFAMAVDRELYKLKQNNGSMSLGGT